MQMDRAAVLASYAASRGWSYTTAQTDEAWLLLSRFGGFLEYHRSQAPAGPLPYLSNIMKMDGEGDGIACDYVTHREVNRGSGLEGTSTEIVPVENFVVMFADNPGMPEFCYRPKSVGLQILQAFGLRRNDGNRGCDSKRTKTNARR